MKNLILLSTLLILVKAMAVTITITTEDTDQAAGAIFMASSLNNWNPADPNFILKKVSWNRYTITINTAEEVEFKLTRGSWDSVEQNIYNEDVANHKVAPNKNISFFVPKWKIIGTKATNVSTLEPTPVLPNLGASRRIQIYLPPNYYYTKKAFPVIYMMDGQNLFNLYESYSGEWSVDKTMNRMFTDINVSAIIVAIDNGGLDRMDEYSPWENSEYGGGKGDLFAQDLVDTIMPIIDSNYRTNKTNYVIGSSMGGLISFYIGLKYPKKFKGMGVLSPSFWFSDKVFDFAKENKYSNQKIFFAAGELEGEGVVNSTSQMFDLIKDQGVVNHKVYPKEAHTEKFWRTIFREVVQYLLTSN